MQYGIRLISQYYDRVSGEVIESIIFHDEEVKKAETLNQLGHTHVEQIDLLQKIQDFKIKHQMVLNSIDTCPMCQSKTQKSGIFTSRFHGPLTDHKVDVQRKKCKCGWSSETSIDGIYGSSIHPDLLKKQALQGAQTSYEKSSQYLNAESAHKRSVNSHSQIYKSVKLIGTHLENVRSSANDNNEKTIKPADFLIAQIDGGHIKARGTARSFEAMVAKVYRPEELSYVDKHHNRLNSKTVVASAKDDQQKTMKTLFKSACRKQGMTKQTHVTGLADGADNCWSIANSITDECFQLTCILDWFHVTMKFRNIAIPEEHKELYEKAKWNVWHGRAEQAVIRLEELTEFNLESEIKTKINSLKNYIHNNRDKIINYDTRKKEGLPYTSNQAESTVNTLINNRQKGKQKMLWSREGAHYVLQIRSSLFSNEWEKDWLKLEPNIYKKAA
jgi:hypothetical protein